MRLYRFSLPVLLAAIIFTAPVQASIVGNGTPGSCTESALDTALSGGGIVTFDCGAALHTITLTSEKVLSQATQIDGAGRIRLDAQGTSRHFVLSSAANYILAGLTLINGRAANADGGSVYVAGATLLMNKVSLLDNLAETAVLGGGRGGAIFARDNAQLTLSEVTAAGNHANSGGVIFTQAGTSLWLSEFVADTNHAFDEGGAISHRGSALTVVSSLFVGNFLQDAGGVGGAIQITQSGSSLRIANSTFYGNAAGAAGSALSAAKLSSNGSIDNSTFSGNVGPSAIAAWTDATLILRNTIMSSDPLVDQNCFIGSGAITDGGHNLQFGSAAAQSCGASIPVSNPLLAPLANNGGYSYTMALQAGSPAVDAGSGCEAMDQRLVARPIGPACDIGAFEAPLGAPPSNSAVAVPALDWVGLIALCALLAGLGAVHRRKFG